MKDDFKGSVLKSFQEFIVILSNDRYIDFFKNSGNIKIIDMTLDEDIIDHYVKLKMKNGEQSK